MATKNIPKWAINVPKQNISYNIYKTIKWYEVPNKNSLSSNMLLYKMIKDDEYLKNLINTIYKNYGNNKIVYGIKNHKGNLRFEF